MEGRISVIVPAYNVETYLQRCVDSILRQTYPHLEVILVDDGSTDGTGALCDALAGLDGRIQVIHKPNGGLSDARNRGLDAATGEYIAFVDSDDWIDPAMYETLVRVLCQERVDLVVCEATRVRDGAACRRQGTGEVFSLDCQRAMEMLIQDRRFHGNAWNKLYARRLWDRVRFPVGRCYEDVHIMHEIYDLCERIAFVDEGLYYYFQRDGSIVHAAQLRPYLDFVHGALARYEYLLRRHPEMRARASALVLSAVLNAFRAVGLHRMELPAATKAALLAEFAKHDANGARGFLSPRLRAEYWLLRASPDLLIRASRPLQRIYTKWKGE